MRKILVFCLVVSLLISLLTPAFAERQFKDVPENHWAAKYVYDLVKMGVTTGYPDGTFRGSKKISRYETAVFIAKMGEKLGGVDLTEVKEDIAKLKQEIAALRRSPTGGAAISANVNSYAKAGNLLTSSGNRGPVMDYRLQTTLARDFGDGSSVAVNLDTMDAGFGGATQDLASSMIDLEGKFNVNLGMEAPVDLTVTMGPGGVEHTDTTGVLSAESGYIYERPDSGVGAETKLWGMNVNGGVWADSIASNGYFDATKVVAGVDLPVGANLPLVSDLTFGATGYYLRAAGGSSTDRKVDLTASAKIHPKVTTGMKIGIGGSSASGLLIGGDLELDDVWNTGTIVNAFAVKIGAQHIDSNFGTDIAGLDYFNRALVNSTVDLGGQIVQAVSEDVSLKGVGDLRLSSDYGYGSGKTNSSLTIQGGVTYRVAPATNLDASYRIFQDPNAADPTTDMAVVGLTYKF